MLDHVTVYVSDLERSKRFYERAFAPLGFRIAFGNEGVFWAFDVGNGCLFEIAQYESKAPITRTHIAFRVKDELQISQFHASALSAGGQDNGKPGPRPQYTPNYYACFVLDPDGHNIECMMDQPLSPASQV